MRRSPGGFSPGHYYYCDQRDVPGTDIWKYADDTSFSETISKNQDSHIQVVFDILANRASWISFNLMGRNTAYKL